MKRSKGVDGCNHTFRGLANQVLPQRMKEMRLAMATPMPMAMFDTRGLGIRGIMKRADVTKDFSGCYVLLRGRNPVYVGISRRVLNRLYSHIRGRSHYQATLAYRMAVEGDGKKMRRSERMKEGDFLRRFAGHKKQMRQWRVAWVRIENSLELHLFEVYCAMELGTVEWNTFRTH